MQQGLRKQLRELKYRISNPKYFTHPVLRPFLHLINCRKKYTSTDLDYISKNRKSDLLFILGIGESINNVTDHEWDVVRQYESLAMNYFLYHSLVPTYYHIEAGRRSKFTMKLSELIQSRKKEYKNVVRLVSSRARRKGMHPRMLPELFIEGQTVCFYEYPALVYCESSRPFRKEDFKNRYQYRGSLNLVLYLAYKLGYKKIVLLGCEMNRNVCFWENIKEAQWLQEVCSENKPLIPWESRSKRETQKYEGVYVTKNKHPYNATILAFNEFVLKPNGVELFVARKENILFPKIPYVNIVDLDRRRQLDINNTCRSNSIG